MHAQVTVGRVAVNVANVNTALIEYEGQPVCTTRQLAEFYRCDQENIKKNFSNNADRFEEGRHFVKLEGEALRQFKGHWVNNGHPVAGNNPVSPNTRNLILWTEKGAARHAKMLSTEKAWEVFEQLEDVYFRAKGAALPARDLHSPADGLMQFRRARALDLATRTAERICAQFPSLGDPARQVIFAKIINPIAGSDVLALPALAERTYCAAEVGERFGITAAMVGRIANRHGLKTPDYGQHVLDKSAHSAKLVEAFRYNERGAVRIGELAAAAVGSAAIRRRVRSVEPQGRQLFE